MFNKKVTVDTLNNLSAHCMVNHLGIEYMEIGQDYLLARMPVDERTKQPYGLLHGGASAAFAETIGSTASGLLIDRETQFCVGLEINANHIKSAKSGFVEGIARAIHIGGKTHIWEIKITNAQHELVCISRLTVMVMDKK